MECDLWNKSGWYYQYSSEKPFSEIIILNKKNQDISKKDAIEQLAKVKFFEQQLVEMIYVGESREVSDDLHIFFSKIDGKWYLAAFDNSGNCDA